MTLIDLSVLSAFWLGGASREAAERLYREHPEWATPVAWRTELRRILDTWESFEQIDGIDAAQIWNAAESQLAGRELFSGSTEVLELALAHGISRFEAEVAACARAEGLRFHTTNPRLAQLFPDHSTLLPEVVSELRVRSGRKAA